MKALSLAVVACLGCGQIIGLGDPRLGDPGANAGSGGSGGLGGEAGGGGGAGGGAPPCEGCTGEVLWSRAYGQTGTTEATALAVKGDGHTVIAGQADGDVDLGLGVTTGSGDGLSVIVFELDEAGDTVWSQRFTGSGAERVEAAAVTPNGDVILVGSFDTDIDFGGLPPGISSGGEDAFVAKLAGNDGAPSWLRTFSGPGDQRARGVDVDVGGRIVVIGDFETSIQLPSLIYASQGATDVFVVELNDDDGDYVDSQVFGGAAAEHGRALAFDADGALVIGGDYESTLDLGGVPLPNGPMIESYVAKLANLNETLWARQLGGNNDQFVCGIAASGCGVSPRCEGIVAVTGGFESEVRFEGADEVSAVYAAQQLLAVLDGDGLLVSLDRLGDTSPSGPAGRVLVPAIDSAGHVLLAGWLEGTALIGSRMLTSAGQDPLYAKLDANGAAFWSHIAGDASPQRATSMAAHGEEGRLTGIFEGTLDMGQGPHACPAGACMFVAALAR